MKRRVPLPFEMPGSGRAAVVALVALLTAAPACTRSSAEDASNIDGFPRLTLVEELRIGDVNDPNLGFSQVVTVDVDRDGNVYVLEAQVPEIRVFDARGELLRRIGRRGQGPGEFERAPRFGVLGDTVWAAETRPARLTLFDREGNVLSAATADPVMIPLPDLVGYLLPWAMRPDGTFSSFFGMVASNRDAPPTGVLPTDSIPVPFVRYRPTGEVVDTIGWAGAPPPRMWRPPEQDDTRIESIQVGDRRFIVPSPPTAMPFWEPLLDGYVLVDAPAPTSAEEARILVTRVGLAGDTVYHRALRYDPVPYAAADLDSIAARAARGEPGGMVPYIPPGPNKPPVPDNWEAIARSLREAMAFPSFQSPISAVRAMGDESIWLLWSDVNSDSADWIVLEPDGSARGVVTLPADTRPLWSRGDVMWVAAPDEFAVPWVVRYTLRSE